MNTLKPILWTGFGLLLLSATPVLADGDSIDNHHTEKRQDAAEHDAMMKRHTDDGTARRHHGDSEGHEGGENRHGKGHRHLSWGSVPSEYAGKTFGDWGNPASVARGEEVFAAQCAVCHGADGLGDGPAAGAQEHKPANFTSHFHLAPGKGDAYLFWRVSEGGTVEPFKSANSAMPAFKEILSEQQRWDVLNYIHKEFHQEFKSTANSKGGGHHEHEDGGGHGG